MKRDLITYIPLVLTGIFLSTTATAQSSNTDSTLSANDSSIQRNDSSVAIARSPQIHDTFRHLYRMNYWVSGVFCAVATAADVYAIPVVIKSKTNLTEQELQALNKNAVPAFDRWALKQNPANRQAYLNAADYSLPVVIASAGFLALDKNVRKDWVRILLMYYEMQAVTFSIYNYSFFGPAFQNKYRPVVYYTQLPRCRKRMGGNNRNSMHSGHAATAVASTFFMVKVYSDYHPELKQKKYILYAVATLPGICHRSYFRVMGLEHFPSDVMIGMTIGAACGILVPEIHRFQNHKVYVWDIIITYRWCGIKYGSGIWIDFENIRRLYFQRKQFHTFCFPFQGRLNPRLSTFQCDFNTIKKFL